MKKSAGILLYRIKSDVPEFFLVHPGGPFWKHKDIGAWSIPKGEFTEEEHPLAAAQREFTEETGSVCRGDFIELNAVKQTGKMIYAWALNMDIDEGKINSNTFSLEWPPKSGKVKAFPEVDKAGWFTEHDAKRKIIPAQAGLIDQLIGLINGLRFS